MKQRIIFVSDDLDEHEKNLLSIIGKYFESFEKKGLMDNREFVFVGGTNIEIGVGDEDIVIFFVTKKNVANEDYVSLLSLPFKKKFFVSTISAHSFRAIGVTEDNFIPIIPKDGFLKIFS
ncbi:MAG: hypothetical protein PHZ07_00350 [Patescibacteria group bacterium]|nr:hypothetical protein [Patescibacteria group bacterium]MDD4304176.1 hypothetical protein [Patescibacteria group bacterium]MDD4695208.1 hypothetical protein [Patescibacteria group bacterium]